MSTQHLLVTVLFLACALASCSGSGDGGNGAPPGGSGGNNSGGRGGSITGGAAGDPAGAVGDDSVGGDSGAAGDVGIGGDVGTGGDGSHNTCIFPQAATLVSAAVPPNYCAYIWASDLNRPRGIVVDSNGDVLVSDDGRIVLLHDDDGNGISDSTERLVLRTQPGLNHGIAINAGYLYASTPTTVYRWPYGGNRQALGNPQSVVTGMPNGGHSTRTLQFDEQGRLYVSIGSGSNVDANSDRARIIRFPANALSGTYTFAEGQLFADGLRNEAGLTIDARGRLWGVENGRDDLQRPDLGTDINQDNPAEELNLFEEQNAGRFYGYPYCWSEYDLPDTGSGSGTQWADPQNTTHDDAWCKDTSNVLPPVLAMQGHSAPLDIKFYPGGSLPAEVVGDAFITFHGSWNRTTATGYKVVRVPFGADGMPSGQPVPLLESANPGDIDPQWPHRPVAIGVGKQGQLLVTSDASGVIIAVGYAG